MFLKKNICYKCLANIASLGAHFCRGKNTSIARGFSTKGKQTSMYKFNETLSPIFIPSELDVDSVSGHRRVAGQ